MTTRKKSLRIQILNHPLALDCLTDVRNHQTTRAVMRDRIRALAIMLFLEASRDLPYKRIAVKTPLARTFGSCITGNIGLVPILRAGLGMVDGILQMIPEARVFHLGLYRDERTLKAIEYYNKLMHHKPVDVAFILDPMLATGGSATFAVDCLKKWGVHRIKLLSLFAAPEGIQRLTTAHPDIAIHVGTVDSHLNKHGYIIPGIGDAGDRQFSGE
jgi:uracil phosphoribosyltransferase